MPFAHQRYATRRPSASASGAHRFFLRRGRSRPWSDRVRGTTTRKCDGFVAICKNVLLRTTGRDFLTGKHNHRRGKPEFGSEPLLDTRAYLATPFVRRRKDDVAAVQQRAHIAKAEAFKQDPKIRHWDAPRRADIVDAAKQCNVPGHSKQT
jgi:hypothetical protein